MAVKKIKKKTSKKAKVSAEQAEPKSKVKVERYVEATGRRKTAVARVRLQSQGQKEFLVNNKPLESYFPTLEMQQIARESLEKMSCLDKFKVLAKVSGGGLQAQAEALRHGISRALLKINPESRIILKKTGFLTRDSRMRERKKFGLKRARRAPQWKKR